MKNKKELKIGEIVYIVSVRDMTNSSKGRVDYAFGPDEFDEDERDVYRIVKEDGLARYYRYPSVKGDFFLVYTRREYINALKKIIDKNNKKLSDFALQTEKDNKNIDKKINMIESVCNNSNGHDYGKWQMKVDYSDPWVARDGEIEHCRYWIKRCKNCGYTVASLSMPEELKEKTR